MNIESRENVVTFIKQQLSDTEKGRGRDGGEIWEWHYGKIELRKLLDYIYKQTPKSQEEML